MWGFMRHGVEPDMVTVGKPMGNGYPMAGVIMRPQVVAALSYATAMARTNGGSVHPAFAAAAVDLALDFGTRLVLGTAVIEITAEPHRGCAKFAERFGRAAMQLVNSADGRAQNLRGVNAKVITPGVVRPGDRVSKTG